MNLLDAETAGDELIRQIVQQLGVGGAAAHATEIIGRVDDAAAEMIRPDPVHHDARGERVIGIRDPFCQLGARVLRTLRQLGSIRWEQNARRPRAYPVALGRVLATNQDMNIRLLVLSHDAVKGG